MSGDRQTFSIPVPPPTGPTMTEHLSRNEFRTSHRAHIIVDTSVCGGCESRACLWACPAALFVEQEDGGILFNYEQCYECGTCDLLCDGEGALQWSYPPGGMGVIFHHG